jgi:hypothetical protein
MKVSGFGAVMLERFFADANQNVGVLSVDEQVIAGVFDERVLRKNRLEVSAVLLHCHPIVLHIQHTRIPSLQQNLFRIFL